MNRFQKKLPFLIFLLLILTFFGKKIIPNNGTFICGIDIEMFIAWINQFIREEFLAGRIPLWNPYNCCGVPLAPQWVFYPTTLLYVLLPLPFAFNLDTLLHLCLGTMGMYCFVYLTTRSVFSGICAGIVYGLSGYFIDAIYAGHQIYLYTNLLLPWLFFFVEKSFHGHRFRSLSLAGAVLGLQLLSGDIQNAYYAAMFISLFYFFRLVMDKTPEGKNENFVLKAAAFVFMPLVSFGIGALQILPSYELLILSLRSEKTYKFATFFSFPPQNFFTFLIPKNAGVINTNWELTGYIGILGLGLAIVGLLFSSHRRMVRIMTVMLIFAVTIMMGHHTPIYKLYYACIPGISNFRLPCRCVIMMVFCLSVLVGLGAVHIEISRLTRTYYMTLCGLLLASGGCLFWGAETFGIPFSSASFLLACGLLASALACLAFFPLLKQIKIGAPLVIGILFLDLYLCFSGLIPVKNIQDIFQRNAVEEFLNKKSPMDRAILPILFPGKSMEQGLGGTRALGHRYFDANGYVMVLNKDYFTFIQNMAGLKALLDKPVETHWLDPRVMDKERVFSSRILNIKYSLIPVQQKWRMVQADAVFPRACIVHDALFLPNMEDHLSYLKDPEFDPRTKALFLDNDREEIQSFININQVGKRLDQLSRESVAEIVEYLPNRIKLRTDSCQDGFLILSEIFYPGWRAYVDGENTPIFRVHYLLRAIPLGAGLHDVVFVYRPLSYIIGGGISVATLLLLIAFGFNCDGIKALFRHF